MACTLRGGSTSRTHSSKVHHKHNSRSRHFRAKSKKINNINKIQHKKSKAEHDGPMSVGKPWHGRLRNAARLAPEGKGYVIAPRTLQRRRNYGLAELVDMVKYAARTVRMRYPRSVLVVGDMSARHGGRVLGHKSHQSGRDVDLGFYLVDRRLRPRPVLDTFVWVDSFGRTKEPHPGLRFDVERNWALVEALLTNPIVRVKLIFVSHEVRDMLLKYAKAIQVPQALYRRAETVLHYFPNHGDHFHVRIQCPGGQDRCIP